VSREAKSDEGEKRRLPPANKRYQIQQKVKQLKEKDRFLMVEKIHLPTCQGKKTTIFLNH
jgi:hypothetical protein